MSYNRASVNNVAPDTSGNIPITTDDIPATANSGYTPLVDGRLASTPISDLSDVASGGGAGEALGYDGASWTATSIGVAMTTPTLDWRYPSAGNVGASPLQSTVGMRTYLGRLPPGIVTQQGGGVSTGYSYTGVPATNTKWPSGFILVSGTYWMTITMRPRCTAPLRIQLRNFSSGDYWGPQALFEGGGTSAGNRKLTGLGTASVGDVVGVEVRSGIALLGNDQWYRFLNVNILKIG